VQLFDEQTQKSVFQGHRAYEQNQDLQAIYIILSSEVLCLLYVCVPVQNFGVAMGGLAAPAGLLKPSRLTITAWSDGSNPQVCVLYLGFWEFFGGGGGEHTATKTHLAGLLRPSRLTITAWSGGSSPQVCAVPGFLGVWGEGNMLQQKRTLLGC
jgi:hypothetical protein